MKEIVKIIIMALIFVMSVWCIFYGQSKIGHLGLLIEIIGISGLLLDLYLYNKKYK